MRLKYKYQAKRKIKRLDLYKIAVLFLSLLSLLNSFCFASKEIIVIGKGRIEQEAINNGIKQAVEQTLGSYIVSTSYIMKGNLVYDHIVSSSAGYVKDYIILNKEKDIFSDTYKIKLKVTVDDAKIKDALEQFMRDHKFQKAFQKASFDERRVMVVYVPRTNFDLPYSSKAVKTVIDLIEDRLAMMGFRVFLPFQTENFTGMGRNKLIDIARKNGGDVIVMVSFDTNRYPATDGYYIISSTLSLKAYDVSTKELFANVQRRGKAVSRNEGYSIQDSTSRVAIKIAPDAVEALVKKIVKRFSSVRQKFILLVLKNVDPQLQNKIEDRVLVGFGWKYRIVLQTPEYMEIEIFSEADPTSMRWILKKQFKKAGIMSLQPIEMKGSRIVFGNI